MAHFLGPLRKPPEHPSRHARTMVWSDAPKTKKIAASRSMHEIFLSSTSLSNSDTFCTAGPRLVSASGSMISGSRCQSLVSDTLRTGVHPQRVLAQKWVKHGNLLLFSRTCSTGVLLAGTCAVISPENLIRTSPSTVPQRSAACQGGWGAKICKSPKPQTGRRRGFYVGFEV